METVKEKEKKSFEVLKKTFGYTNHMAAPRLVKIAISSGTGSGMKRDRKRNELVMDRLMKITGQKPSIRVAKKSVAGFKSREGDQIGLSLTLRGSRMYAFIDKLINIAIPRTKDFRGIDPKVVDSMGNLTFGIREHVIFPETPDEELKDVFGLAITLVTTAKSKDEALAFFKELGVPFKK
ncbi:50S ribosomal protein L5 [Candidatus Wolfebacteria bacterium]|nr:MAG: 50S ribosomal protein L5 [Candidatus Wolfebacteria bacterium]